MKLDEAMVEEELEIFLNEKIDEDSDKIIEELSNKSWEFLMNLLKELKVEKTKIRTDVEKETKKTRDKIRYIKQLLLEYKDESQIMKEKLLEFLEYLDKKYLKLIDEFIKKEEQDNYKIGIVISALIRKKRKEQLEKFKND